MRRRKRQGMPYAHDRQNRMGRDVVSGGSPGGTLGKTACRLSDRKNIMENEISARQKQILVLYYKEKKTMPEIARQLGVCISTVSRTHRRACETVRSRLRSYGLLG